MVSARLNRLLLFHLFAGSGPPVLANFKIFSLFFCSNPTFANCDVQTHNKTDFYRLHEFAPKTDGNHTTYETSFSNVQGQMLIFSLANLVTTLMSSYFIQYPALTSFRKVWVFRESMCLQNVLSSEMSSRNSWTKIILIFLTPVHSQTHPSRHISRAGIRLEFGQRRRRLCSLILGKSVRRSVHTWA